MKNIGYGIVAHAIMSDPNLTAEAKAIYAYLSAYAGKTNQAYPSLVRMARELGMSESRLLRHRRQLIERQILVIRHEVKRTKFSTNTYFLDHGLPNFPSDHNECTEKTTQQNVGTNNTKPNNTRKNSLSVGQAKTKTPYQTILDYLNQKAKRQYKNVRANQKLIAARFNEGCDLNDFRQVIDVKCAQWLGTELEKYLRPATLFGNKFDQYLNEALPKDSQMEVPYFVDDAVVCEQEG
ncbi:conserved phage C-terminal domain-containing protein [Enterococcus sp. CSURQ0835]|uniref:conserved phage C-terminal domain-containing protein n=1 Tax=Enterococcus sp. CSURQ0835 TaxID=2681394 RepID=UPI00135B1CA2|nr:conserved phage C-terminal domain-containing protein [Enterococcus sp. CSURQ0835]